MKMVFQAMNPHVLIRELLGDFPALHKSIYAKERGGRWGTGLFHIGNKHLDLKWSNTVLIVSWIKHSTNMVGTL